MNLAGIHILVWRIKDQEEEEFSAYTHKVIGIYPSLSFFIFSFHCLVYLHMTDTTDL